MKSEQIILASKSPRRRELLEQVGISFSVIPAEKEEAITTADPVEAVKQLSYQKALEVGEQQKEGIVIGADTIVVYDGKLMGKPADQEDAARMLWMLQGKRHSVYTGVTLLHLKKRRGDWETVTFAQKTNVTFYPMTKEEIAAYIQTGEPMDKAGAYGIQGRAAAYIREISGDYNNVVGLPVARIYQEMKVRGWIR